MRPADGAAGTAIGWLLASAEPAVRALTRRHLLDDDEGAAAEHVMDGPIVRALLAGQDENGGFGADPYKKWTGTHWRLVSLVELGVPAGEPRAVRAAGTVLDWLTGDPPSRDWIRPVVTAGVLPRCHASIHGNAVTVASRLGLAGDPRVGELVEVLLRCQWPDGGWNCDERASGRRSSFHETLVPCLGLHEYWLATGDRDARAAARRAAGLLLEHRLFRATGAGSLESGQVIRREWTALHYPPYWHYDILQALLVLARMGLAGDAHCADALAVLDRRRLPNGRWRPGGYWWSPPGSAKGMVDVVDWGRSAPNEMITLNALRVRKAAAAPPS